MEDLFDMVSRLSTTCNPEKTTTRYVYVAQFENGEIKIGMSKTPEKRLNLLARQERTTVLKSHYKKFYEAPTIERTLLEKYAPYIAYGNEYLQGADFVSIKEDIDTLYLEHGCKEC